MQGAWSRLVLIKIRIPSLMWGFLLRAAFIVGILSSEPGHQLFRIGRSNLWSSTRVAYRIGCRRRIRDRRRRKGVELLFYVCSCRSMWRIFLFCLPDPTHCRMSFCRPSCRTLTQGLTFPLFSIFQKYKVRRMLIPYLPHQFVRSILLWEASVQQKGLHPKHHWWSQIHGPFGNIWAFPWVLILKRNRSD